jgi:opacity protein-like surface antigen
LQKISTEEKKMKKYLLLFMALLLMIPGFVFSDLVTFKVGYFFPRANSDLWQLEFEQMSFTKDDFQDTVFCFTYEYFLSNEISLALGLDGYSEKKVGSYIDYVGDVVEENYYAFDYGQGSAISHVFTVAVTPLQASIKLTPMGRRASVIPYVGGGVGLYIWTVRMQGDTIDFADPQEFYDIDLEEVVIGYPIYPTDIRRESKLTVGFHGFVGIMVPVANKISVEGEFKFNYGSGNLEPEFQGFENFDLSAYQITIGINYWF